MKLRILVTPSCLGLYEVRLEHIARLKLITPFGELEERPQEALHKYNCSCTSLEY